MAYRLDEALYAYLAAYAGLIALVADRIYKVVAPEVAIYPRVVVQKIDEPVHHTMSSDAAVYDYDIQVSCYSDTYSSAKAVETQILAALKDYTGTMPVGDGNAITIQRILFEGSSEFYESDIKIYHIPIDFNISWS